MQTAVVPERKLSRLTWRAALLVGAILALAPTVLHAESGISGGGMAVTVRFAIPAIAQAHDVQHPQFINIEAQHLAQGFIDIDRGTQLLLTTNADGCIINIGYDSSWISAVETRVDGKVFSVANGAPGPMIFTQRAANVPISFGYRLYLKPNTPPGMRAWPLTFKLAAVPPEQFMRVASNSNASTAKVASLSN